MKIKFSSQKLSKNLFNFFTKYNFFVILLCFLLAFGVAALIFHKYVSNILIGQEYFGSSNKDIEINQRKYNGVLNFIEQREKRLNSEIDLNYKSPF